MVGLGHLPGLSSNSSALGISADGSTVVGFGSSGSGFGAEAFVWTSGGGMVGLGDLPGGTPTSFAYDVSADGSTIVGTGSGTSGDKALIWDETNGMRDLNLVLTALGLDLTGWTLVNAQGISDDGLTITGYGTNPSGFTEAWIATIPEPSTAVLLTLGLVGLAARGSRLENSPRPGWSARDGRSEESGAA